MRIGIIGGGLQGCCLALECALRGADVTIFEKAPRHMTAASAQNEGKIHLGYVYGNDESRRTARLMIRGALAFETLLKRWLGSEVVARFPVSDPFKYVAHKASIVPLDATKAHFEDCNSIVKEIGGKNKPAYFGRDVFQHSTLLSSEEQASLFNECVASAVFQTPEIAIDPASISAAFQAAIQSEPRIQSLFSAKVTNVEKIGERIRLKYIQDASVLQDVFDHVVNAAWDGRLLLDAQMGLTPTRPWLWRVKHYLRVFDSSVVAMVPSSTMVLGKFGDIVNYQNGSFFLSWYPSGMLGRSSDLSPPSWQIPPDQKVQEELRSSIPANLRRIVPALDAMSSDAISQSQVEGGVIYALGSNDIDDLASELHDRFDVGPRSLGRYHTIDTGKYTVAPLFALELADTLCPQSKAKAL